MTSTHLRLLWLLPLLALSCATRTTAATRSEAPTGSPDARERTLPEVRQWGAMRTVLRDGNTQGRVDLAEAVGAHSVAVGVLADLAGEVTVDGGVVHVAEVLDSTSPEGVRVRAAADGEQAALLVLADVESWTAHALPAVSDLAALESAVRSLASENGIDVRAPFPFRVEGVARALSLHVLDHSCPIADPDGPPPWRLRGEDEAAVLIGFYAEDSAGTLTHHGQATHVHAVLADRGASGHLDDVRLAAGAWLFLPSGRTGRP